MPALSEEIATAGVEEQRRHSIRTWPRAERGVTPPAHALHLAQFVVIGLGLCPGHGSRTQVPAFDSFVGSE